MEAKLIFSNEIEMNVEQNGNCFIVNNKPEFPEDLSIVTIINTDGTQILHDVQIIECASIDNRYWFSFTEESEYDKTIRYLQEQNTMLEACILEMSEIIYN